MSNPERNDDLPSLEEAKRLIAPYRDGGVAWEDVPWQLRAPFFDDPYARALFIQQERAEEAIKAREAAQARREELIALAEAKRAEAEAALAEVAEIEAKHGPALARAEAQAKAQREREAAQEAQRRSAEHNNRIFAEQRAATVARLHPDLPEQQYNAMIDRAFEAAQEAKRRRAAQRLNNPMGDLYGEGWDD